MSKVPKSTTYYRKLRKIKAEYAKKYASTPTATAPSAPSAPPSAPSLDPPITPPLNENDDRNNEALTSSVGIQFVDAADDMGVDDDDDNNDTAISDEDEGEMPSLFSELAQWAIQHSIRQSALNGLLTILKPFVTDALPKDARTLLKTPKAIVTSPMGVDGAYWHFGLENCLSGYFDNLAESLELHLSFNIDGLPIGSSSKKSFWPILFNINDLRSFKPMIIGIWCGEIKPKVNEYLQPFIDELQSILEYGITISENVRLTIKIVNFICDSPARSLLKTPFNSTGIMVVNCAQWSANMIKKGKR